jgi:hypothetical protein
VIGEGGFDECSRALGGPNSAKSLQLGAPMMSSAVVTLEGNTFVKMPFMVAQSRLVTLRLWISQVSEMLASKPQTHKSGLRYLIVFSLAAAGHRRRNNFLRMNLDICGG